MLVTRGKLIKTGTRWIYGPSIQSVYIQSINVGSIGYQSYKNDMYFINIIMSGNVFTLNQFDKEELALEYMEEFVTWWEQFFKPDLSPVY